jgi:hypothetical protein
MTVSSSLLTSSPPCRASSNEEPRLPAEAPLACYSRIVGAVCSAVFPRSAAEYALVVSEALRLWDTPGMCGIVVVCKEKGIREAERRKRKAGGGKITGDK